MRSLLFLLFLVAAGAVHAQPVYLRNVQIDGAVDENARKLSIALNQDLATVLDGKGIRVVPQSAAEAAVPALRLLKECKDENCARKVYAAAGYTRVLVPFLQRKKGSENLLCYLYRVDGDRVTEENLLVLFINLPVSERRAAISSVMVQFFPDEQKAVEVPPKADPEPKKQDEKLAHEDKAPSKEEDTAQEDHVTRHDSEKAERPVRERMIRIVASPPSDIFVDGTRAGTTPFEMPADGRLKTVRLSAAGCEDMVVPLRATDAVEMKFSLRCTPGEERGQLAGPPYWGAFARSLLFPGWGQSYKGDQLSAYAFGISGAAFAGTAFYSSLAKRTARDAIIRTQQNQDLFVITYGINLNNTVLANLGWSDYFLRTNRDVFETTQTSCASRDCARYRSYRLLNRYAVGAFSITYIWSALDALLRGPRREDQVSFEFLPVFGRGDYGPERGALFAATTRF